MKNIVAFRLSLLFSFTVIYSTLNSQDVYKDQRSAWLQKAEESKLVLIEAIKQPISLVSLAKDEKVFQHWKAITPKPVDSLYNNSFKKQSGVVVDFDEHLTGYFSFSIVCRTGYYSTKLLLDLS